MKAFLLAISLCVLAVPASAQESSAPASPQGTPGGGAYGEWERQHAEWQRRYAEWEKRYQKWLEEQARLDDGFLLSVGVGPSPARINAAFSGGNSVEFPDIPPYPEANLRGMGGIVDVRMGWLVENDPYLKDYWYGNDELHDQLYITLDLITRHTPYPQYRFPQNDSANTSTYFRPLYILDFMAGLGMTYLVYPYRTSFSTTIGFGLMGMQGEDQAVRTNIGPAFNARVGQEWALRENWRSGFAIGYGFIQSINPSHTKLNEQGNIVKSYQERYNSHLFTIQWINSFTPPKYRRGVPPSRPQQYNPNAR